MIPALPDKSELDKLDTFRVTVFPVTVEDTEPVPKIDNVSPKLTTSVVDVLSLIVKPEFVSELFAMFDKVLREPLIVLFVTVCDWSVDKKSVPLNAVLNSVNVPEMVLLVRDIALFVRVAEAFAVNTEALTLIWNLPLETKVSIPKPPSIVIGLPILALNVVEESSAKSM